MHFLVYILGGAVGVYAAIASSPFGSLLDARLKKKPRPLHYSAAVFIGTALATAFTTTLGWTANPERPWGLALLTMLAGVIMAYLNVKIDWPPFLVQWHAWRTRLVRGVNRSAWTNVVISAALTAMTYFTSRVRTNPIVLLMSFLAAIWLLRWWAHHAANRTAAMVGWLFVGGVLWWGGLRAFLATYYPALLRTVPEIAAICILTILLWAYVASVCQARQHAKFVINLVKGISATLLAVAFLIKGMDTSAFLKPTDVASAQFMRDHMDSFVELVIKTVTLPYVLAGIWASLVLDWRDWRAKSEERPQKRTNAGVA